MKTEDFIDFLATGAGPAPEFNMSLKFRAALLAGLAASLGMGLVANGMASGSLPSFVRWSKLVYAMSVLTFGWVLLKQLARPLSDVRASLWGLLLVVLVMAGFGVSDLTAASSDQYDDLLRGHTWLMCSMSILLFSLPALAAALWMLRSMAPTRLRLAGFAAGIFAGAQGALGYCIVGPDDSPLFVAIWYTLGIALSGLLGMLLGPRVLRW